MSAALRRQISVAPMKGFCGFMAQGQVQIQKQSYVGQKRTSVLATANA
jgi:hypothetical protein